MRFRFNREMWGRRLRIVFILLPVLILLHSCTAVNIKVVRKVIKSYDSYPVEYYELLDGKKDRIPDRPRAMFFYIQGSEYESVINKTEMMASAVIFGARAIMVEKRGCSMDTIDIEAAYKFSEKYVRVQDYNSVLNEELSKIAPDIPVILIGGSEGGDIASVLAAKNERVSYLVLIGSGGGISQKEEFRQMVMENPGYLGCNNLKELEDVFSKIDSSYNSEDLWAGHPYKRWKSYWNDSSLAYLKNLDIPILLVHGTEDMSVPVKSARGLKNTFDSLGKKNLTYIEYPELNHSLTNIRDNKSRYPYLEVDLIRWLQKNGIVSKIEADIFLKRVKKNHKDIF